MWKIMPKSEKCREMWAKRIVTKMHWEAQSLGYCHKGKVSPEDMKVGSTNHKVQQSKKKNHSLDWAEDILHTGELEYFVTGGQVVTVWMSLCNVTKA